MTRPSPDRPTLRRALCVAAMLWAACGSDDAADATRKVAGTTLPISWTDADGVEQHNDYGVPNTNECHDCHGEAEALDTLGVVTRQLEGHLDHCDGPDNQLDRLDHLGYFTVPTDDADGRPVLVDPMDATAPLEECARAYLDANCGSCHRPDAAAASFHPWLDA